MLCYEHMNTLRKAVLFFALLLLAFSFKTLLSWGLLLLVLSHHPRLLHTHWPAAQALKDLLLFAITSLDDVLRCLLNSPYIEPKGQDRVPERTRTFFLYENERWWLGKGWLKRLISQGNSYNRTVELKYSDRDHKVERHPDTCLVPEGMEWAGGWQVELVKDSDEFGWQYSLDFNSTFQAKKGVLSMVRRRRLIRTCQQA